jgi:precorrin-6B C5,15-methyltransferase / cobalt-precorrin-6B C5,C15-methyltransferase
VIGCDGRPLLPAAVDAIAGAALVAGARRHLETVQVPPAAERVVINRLEVALDAICASRGPAAVLASGDPGFFGIVRALRARGITPEVIPAVSSVALAFGRLGLDWDDALVLSAHGRDVRPVRAAALAHPKVAILTGPPGAGMGQLRSDLLAAGRKVYVAERLGAADERVRDLTQSPAGDVMDPHVLIALDPAVAGPGAAGPPRWLAGHLGAPAGWAMPEESFEHRDSMITKSEVRALVLAKLGPGPGRIVWDVGAGCGSVAVECARFGAWAVAIEADPEQCARIRRNAAAHGVCLRVVAGRAPGVLAGLPEPDAMFVGGGDDGVLSDAVRTARPGRVVVTLASVDRVRSVGELLTGLGYRVAGSQVQAARLAGLPGGSVRLAAVNPVFVIWADSAAAAGDSAAVAGESGAGVNSAVAVGEKGRAAVTEGSDSEAHP